MGYVWFLLFKMSLFINIDVRIRRIRKWFELFSSKYTHSIQNTIVENMYSFGIMLIVDF